MLAVELVFFLSCIFYRLVPSWEVVEPKCLFWPCINFFIYSSWIFWKIYFWYDLIIPQPQSIPHWSRRYCNWCMCARQGTTALLNGRNQPANNMELCIAIPVTAGSSAREDWQSAGVVPQMLLTPVDSTIEHKGQARIYLNTRFSIKSICTCSGKPVTEPDKCTVERGWQIQEQHCSSPV